MESPASLDVVIDAVVSELGKVYVEQEGLKQQNLGLASEVSELKTEVSELKAGAAELEERLEQIEQGQKQEDTPSESST